MILNMKCFFVCVLAAVCYCPELPSTISQSVNIGGKSHTITMRKVQETHNGCEFEVLVDKRQVTMHICQSFETQWCKNPAIKVGCAVFRLRGGKWSEPNPNDKQDHTTHFDLLFHDGDDFHVRFLGGGILLPRFSCKTVHLTLFGEMSRFCTNCFVILSRLSGACLLTDVPFRE
jgi:hypothetical protein